MENKSQFLNFYKLCHADLKEVKNMPFSLLSTRAFKLRIFLKYGSGTPKSVGN